MNLYDNDTGISNIGTNKIPIVSGGPDESTKGVWMWCNQ